MGGIKSRPKYNNTPCIRRNNVETTIYNEKITKYNYETRLRQYNLTFKEINIIKSGFFCKSRKNQRVNKFIFNDLGSGIFEMSCLTFNIVTNCYNEKEVKIIKNKLRYIANATTEEEKKGWGILFWYRKRTTKNRALTFDEIENIRQEMQKKIEIKLLC